MWGMGFIWLGELVDSGNLDLRRWVGGSGCLWNTRCLKDEHPEAHANTSQDGAPPSEKLVDKPHENSSHNYGLWYL